MIPALPSRRLLCERAGGHRFWPIRGKPGESVCIRCGCTEYAPRVKAWPVFRRATSAVLHFAVRVVRAR